MIDICKGSGRNIFRARGMYFEILTGSGDVVTLVGYMGSSGTLIVPGSVRGPFGKEYIVVGLGHVFEDGLPDVRSSEPHSVSDECPPNDPSPSGQWARTGILPSVEVQPFFSTSLQTLIMPRTTTVLGSMPLNFIRDLVFTSRLEKVSDRALRGSTRLAHITIPESLERIPDGMFQDCDGLETISIPKGVREIGRSAFMGCYGLGAIRLPRGLESIGDDAFNGCSSLSSVDIPYGVVSIGDNAFRGCRALTYLYVPGTVNRLGKGVFSDCNSLSVLVIKGGPISVVEEFFDNSMHIGHLELGAGIKAIGEFAFLNRHRLKSVVLSEGLESIDENAFESCTSLRSVMIPSTVNNIGVCSFAGCDSLEFIGVCDGNGSYSSYDGCLYNNDRTTLLTCPNGRRGRVEIPSGVHSVASQAFQYCNHVTEVVMSDDVRELDALTFDGCNSLRCVTLSRNLKALPLMAFADCEFLESVTIGPKVTVIGQYAFCGCSSLKEIEIPKKVVMLEKCAFSDCSSLERVRFGRSLKHIPSYAFRGCVSLKCIESDPDNEGFIVHDGALYTRDMRELVLYPSGSDEEELVLPRSVECIRPGALLCARNLKRVSVEAGNDHFVSDDGILYSRDMRELVFHPSGRDIVLREGIEHVCSDAFSCSDITSVTIPEGTMSIGSYAFYGCKGLKEVALPGSLISIEQRAFYGCTSLEAILFTGKQESVHIGERSFAYCPVGIDLRSGVDGWEFEAFRLEGTMLYSLPEEGIRHFSGVLGLMWYDDTE